MTLECDFITGVIENKLWDKLCNTARSGKNGLWGVYLDSSNMTGCPAIVGVILPEWERFQIIRGEYGITVYGETESTLSNIIDRFYKIVGVNGVNQQ